MANDNFDSTPITSKAVSLVVAIVVFACVLVPVCEAMSNTGGGEGGGGTEVLNDYQAMYAEMGFDISPYKSYQIYFKDSTPTLPQSYHYDLESIRALADSLPASNGVEYTVPIFECRCYFDDGLYIPFSLNYWDELYYNMFFPDAFGEGQDYTPGEPVTDDNIVVMEFTLNTDYTFESRYQTTKDAEPYVTTGTAEYVNVISVEESGYVPEYVYSYDEDTDAEETEYMKFTIGGKFVLIDTPTYVSGGQTLVPSSLLYYEGMITEDMLSNGTITLELSNELVEGVYTIPYVETSVAGVYTFSDDTYNNRSVEYVSGSYEWDSDLYGNIFVPTTISTGSGTSTGSNVSGSGNGTVNTLVGVIPVFVALALILYIVSMFYNPNRIE